VEVKATRDGVQAAVEVVDTAAGLVEAVLTLTEPGEFQIVAVAGPNIMSERMPVSVSAPPSPTPTPTIILPTAAAADTVTPAPSPTSVPAATDTPTVSPAIEAEVPPPATPAAVPRHLDGVDLLSALSATLLAGLLGFWLGQQSRQPLSRRVRLGLWVLIGGLVGYLLYGAGWLRPEQWILAEPDLLAGRLAVAGLTFLFGLIGLVLNRSRGPN
jgi:hypothetical protein